MNNAYRDDMSLKPPMSPLPRSRSVSPITVAERLRLEDRLRDLRRKDDEDQEKRNNSLERKEADPPESPRSRSPIDGANNIRDHSYKTSTVLFL